MLADTTAVFPDFTDFAAGFFKEEEAFLVGEDFLVVIDGFQPMRRDDDSQHLPDSCNARPDTTRRNGRIPWYSYYISEKLSCYSTSTVNFIA